MDFIMLVIDSQLLLDIYMTLFFALPCCIYITGLMIDWGLCFMCDKKSQWPSYYCLFINKVLVFFGTHHGLEEYGAEGLAATLVYVLITMCVGIAFGFLVIIWPLGLTALVFFGACVVGRCVVRYIKHNNKLG